MAIATTVKHYLNRQHISYSLIRHPYAVTARSAARAAGIDTQTVAKSVIVEDDDGYVMAVIPATHRLHLGRLDRLLHRHLGLATEQELLALFPDCEPGAIPAVGQPYHMPTVVDDALAARSDIYFEAGDHEMLVHLSQSAFQTLTHDSRHGRISRSAD